MAKKTALRWTDAPAAHDYPAAASYLRLVVAPQTADAVIDLLSQQQMVAHPAKDLLRAAGLPLLAAEDAEVAKDMKRARKGVKLSPVLLVRGDLNAGYPLQIVDGYHRVCASYHLSENTEVPCRIVALPGASNP